jgi:hypothetical protein
MGSEQQRSRGRRRGWQDGGMVARSIDTRLELGCGRALEEPGARREMGVAERRPPYTTVGRAADRRELVEVPPQAIGVDTGRRSRCA